MSEFLNLKKLMSLRLNEEPAFGEGREFGNGRELGDFMSSVRS